MLKRLETEVSMILHNWRNKNIATLVKISSRISLKWLRFSSKILLQTLKISQYYWKFRQPLMIFFQSHFNF